MPPIVACARIVLMHVKCNPLCRMGGASEGHAPEPCHRAYAGRGGAVPCWHLLVARLPQRQNTGGSTRRLDFDGKRVFLPTSSLM